MKRDGKLCSLGTILLLLSFGNQSTSAQNSSNKIESAKLFNYDNASLTKEMSHKLTLERYLASLVESRSKRSDQCPTECLNREVPDSCELSEDNWLVSGDNDWDYDIGYRVLFTLFYLVLLVYLFVGVSIVSDIFMTGIEVITSQERTVRVKTETGEVITMQVKVWNETVANLTLMALGSSAPEIMLAIVEVIADGFTPGMLGPGTVVGSAAFNFFIIIAICILALKNGEKKKIDKYYVFIFTFIFSIWAYVWMIVMILWVSPCVIDIWEAFLTFAFFPIMVIIAWRIDVAEGRRLDRARKVEIIKDVESGRTKSMSHFEDRSLTMLQSEGGESNSKRNLGEATNTELNIKLGSNLSSVNWSKAEISAEPNTDRKFKLTNTRKQEFLYRFQTLKKENPDIDDEDLLNQVANTMLGTSRKSNAHYRLVALGKDKNLKLFHARRQRRTWNFNKTRVSTSQNHDFKSNWTTARRTPGVKDDPNPDAFKVYFDPHEYVVAEDIGHVTLYVVRLLNKGNAVADFNTKVDFKTVEGTAKAEKDYIAKKGTLIFEPGEFIKPIEIVIVNDDVYEDDEYFTVVLSSLVNYAPGTEAPDQGTPDPDSLTKQSRRTSKKSWRKLSAQQSQDEKLNCVLLDDEARVVILDEDHRGIFAFELDQKEVEERENAAILTVRRFKGARGVVEVGYSTDEFTAKPGVDYENVEGVLTFENGEIRKDIIVPIINTVEYEKEKLFHVHLREPKALTSELERYGDKKLTKKEIAIDLKGEPKLGTKDSCLVTIVESKQLRSKIDEVSDRLSVTDVLKKKTYADQFRDAVTVQGDEDEETGELKEPNKCNWCCHIFTIFWKVLFATIPPPGYLSGWFCFIGALVFIGLLTWVIEMVATNLGCAAGLKDMVTAISLVALGTSLPDTFASRMSAVADDNADNAIGNVTGSNAVNVYLGIGLAWVLGSCVQVANGCTFYVEPGDLAFNVLLFTCLSLVGVLILIYRRFNPSIGAELGGPKASKIVCAIIFIFLWLIYLVVAVLDAYEVINPDF